ncbi:MAG: L-aspartate oxidase [Flavobacteriales bacterium]|nr:L-aspartate oxidase [Flavobacteriales bacterium]
MYSTDILVLGSGIAGLTFAIKSAIHFPEKKITLITKADESESNTKYAQGGIAVVHNEINDSFEKHITDTLKAGDGLCNTEVVEMVVKEGPQRLNEIISWGVEFDKDKEGKFYLGKEGGHSENRILHFKDITGLQIEEKLLSIMRKLPNITVLNHHFALDLITEHHLKINTNKPTCFGAYVLNKRNNKVETFLSKITLVATGGMGQIYRTTTNPLIATGDGIAMAYRAKAEIKNMEFIQFHPTAFYDLKDNPAFLITEAIRGAGAYLRDKNGERFMLKYDQRGELASRDIVAIAIDSELKKTGADCVFLDCTHLDKKLIEKQFPTIYNQCKAKGIDLLKDYIPVVPAAHYLCGGIVSDKHAHTTISHLFVCGECAYTGLHGANRLASNSLLEALVYAHHAFLHTQKIIENIHFNFSVPEWDAEGKIEPEEKVLIKYHLNELKNIMNDYVGIVRSNERLKKASDKIYAMHLEVEKIYKTTIISQPLCELRNMIAVCTIVIKHSMQRKENKGGFYNINLVSQ